jgi:hypothetical protein
MLSLPIRLKLSIELLCSIDARRKAASDQGIGSAVERDRRAGARMDVESGVAGSSKPVTNTLRSAASERFAGQELRFRLVLKGETSAKPTLPTGTRPTCGV